MSERSAEASALHAILAGDPDDAERILTGFLPGELRALERACGELGALCADVRRDPMYGVSEAPGLLWTDENRRAAGVDVGPPESILGGTVVVPPGAVVDVAPDLDDATAEDPD